MLEKKGEIKRKNAGRIAGAALLLLLLLAAVIYFSGGRKNASSRDARLGYITSLGWEVDEESEEQKTVQIPDCSEGAMRDYNALMQKAGFDLSPYEEKSVEQYQYVVTNYPNCDQKVFLTLYVYDGKVIGGEIHTAAIDGFMHELRARVDN